MKLLIIRELLSISFSTLKSHKLRSLLTVVGVMIGVMTVIGMVSVIEGINRSFMQSLQSIGSSLIFISKHEPGIRVGRMSEEERTRKGFTYEDAIAIERLCPSVGEVTYQHYYSLFDYGSLTVKYRNERLQNPSFLGVNSEYLEVFENPVKDGRFFTKEEMLRRVNVCVLGMEIVEALFPHSDPIGKEIMIGNDKFRVIGYFEKRGKLFGESRDNQILIPFFTFEKLYPQVEDVFIAAKPKSPELIFKAIEEIEEVLRRRRGVPFGKPNNFAVFTQDTIASLYNQLTQAVYIVMIIIASISLLVGGIGVMNIMLVSVRERLREIGIRKAIGARNRDILWQFLFEAMTLAGIGGIIGIFLGWMVSIGVKEFTPLPAAVSLWSVFIGFLISLSVGIFFGIFPAQKAAKQSPIEALRYE
ncbi:MAG: ABC transporter permease [Acidobacteriota bacterium]